MDTKFNRQSLNHLSCIYSWVIKKNIKISVIYGLILMFLNLGVTIFQKSTGQPSNTIIAFSLINTAIPVFVFTLILSGVIFSYMHKKRSVDLFNSLPITRTSMLLGRYFAGLTLIIVPFILVSAISIALTFSMDNIFTTLLYFYITLALSVIASFTFSTFIAVCSGNKTDMMVSIFSISIAYPALILLSNILTSFIIPGYRAFNNISILSVTAFSPYISFINSLGTNLVKFLIWFVLFCIVFLGLSIILNKRRKSEVAEEPFALPILIIIIRALVSLVIGIAAGLTLYLISIFNKSMGHYNHFFFIITFIISSFCAHLIIDAIYSKGFKNIVKGLKYYCITLAIFLAFYGSLCFGFFGLDSRLPDTDDISSVTIILDTPNDGMFLQTYSYPFFNSNGSLVLDPVLKEQESINAVLDFNKIAVSDIKDKNYPYALKSNDEEVIEDIKITYNLKDGTCIDRFYQTSSLGENSLKKLAEITYLPEYKNEIVQIFNIGPNDLSRFIISNEASSEEINDASPEQKDQLICALQQDITNDTAEKRYVYNITSNNPQTKITLIPISSAEKMFINDPKYLIPDYYTNTWSVINNNGWFPQ